MDKLLESILQEVDHEHTEKDLLPMMRLHVRDRFGANHACRKDADTLCPKEEESSLHCLGQHVDKLSKPCIKAIEKAVPFVCSMEISLLCPPEKLLETSVLQCLESRIRQDTTGKMPISERCRDSIASTRSIVNQLKQSRPHLFDVATGEILTVYNAGKSLVRTVFTVLLYGSLAVAVLLGVAYFVWKDQTLLMIKTTARHGREALVSGDKELADAKKHDFYDAALI
jgi:hypothetical protein